MPKFIHEYKMDGRIVRELLKTKYYISTALTKNPSKTYSYTYKDRCATFQSSMKLTIVIGQCFGLLPVVGVSDIDTFKLRFSYTAARCVYTIVSILGQATLAGFCLRHIIRNSTSSLGMKTALFFFSSNLTTTIMFLRMASKWPGLCQHISLTEARDSIVNAGLINKCNMYCIGIVIMAWLEHVLFDVNTLVHLYDCYPGEMNYDTFLYTWFSWIFDVIDYDPIIGTLAMFFNIQCTFNWNFADIFVICISLYLTERLDQINTNIASMLEKTYVSPANWRSIRENYNIVAGLVKHMDDVIGCITFISFANNLFFICIQMLHLLQPLKGNENVIYFMYSLIFLITRWLAVSLVAAEVHTASRRPLYALYRVPSALYCTEVRRFIEQIHGDTIALTGLQLFKLKRGLVMTVAGTMATYEMVLMQYSGVIAPTPSSDVINTLPK